MFSITLRYLCGFSSAAPNQDSYAPEWPPHPDRVYMALVSAYKECDQTDDERSALEWLEGLPPPAITCSALASSRMELTVFVPINDYSDPVEKKGSKEVRHQSTPSFPIGRARKPRFFPTAFPEDDTVHLIYDAELTIEHRAALASLCAKVAYVGDTSSLVQMWINDAPPSPTLVPVTKNHYAQRLRVPYAGRLIDLERQYQRDLDAGEYRPRHFRSGYYAPPSVQPHTVPHSQYNLLIFRRVAGDNVDIRDTLALTNALRGAVMNAAPQPPPEWVSGHTLNGDRTKSPHLAFLALPNVGHDHADGTLKGVALAVPDTISKDNVNILLDGLFGAMEPHPATLAMGRLGVWQIEPDDSLRPLLALTPRTWCQPTYRWASVTPIVLDRFPKADGDAEATIARACRHIGLPQPRDVVLLPGSVFVGVPPVRHMPLLPTRNGKGAHRHTHALLIFNEPVAGPIFLGVGRFRGYGLCRPYDGGDK